MQTRTIRATQWSRAAAGAYRGRLDDTFGTSVERYSAAGDGVAATGSDVLWSGHYDRGDCPRAEMSVDVVMARPINRTASHRASEDGAAGDAAASSAQRDATLSGAKCLEFH
jgi:hypothetical protein